MRLAIAIKKRGCLLKDSLFLFHQINNYCFTNVLFSVGDALNESI